MSSADIARKMRRNLQAGVSMAFPNLARERINVLHCADDPERLCVNKPIEKLPALDRAIFIQDHQTHMLDVVIERVTERDHLNQRREKHEEKSHRIAPDDNEFLKQDGTEAAERSALHEISCSRFAMRS